MSKDVSVIVPDAVIEATTRCRDQRGMVSAEWAVGIIAAVAIAGVLLGTLNAAQDGYAAFAAISTFTASYTEQHPTDLAMLRGKRLVVAQDTEAGRSWAIAKIKMMTGGDMITARFMRQDFFEYIPQFKLLIAGNHRPSLRSVDEAIRRRFHLIPFKVTIPPNERDLDLPEKLKAEGPGILQWTIEGCLLWQERGLNPPEIVRVATPPIWRAKNE